MFEFIVLLIGAVPFLVGIFAIRMMKKDKDEGSDDPPPPPDPTPPLPLLPPTPEPRRLHKPLPQRTSRAPVPQSRIRTPSWRRTVRS